MEAERRKRLLYQRKGKMRKNLFSAAILAIGGVISATAATFTFSTSPGALSTNNQAVDAQAVIMTGAGVITIQLFDLQIDPHDASQVLSGLMFSLDQSASVSGSVVPTAPNGLVDVNGNGPATPTTGPIASWALSNVSGSVIKLDSLIGGPSQTVLGPTDASFTPTNSLIYGPRNPYINQEADFSIAISGVTGNTKVLGASFGFGAEVSNYLSGDLTPPGQASVAPEPATIVMAASGIGLAAIGALRRKKKTA
jgi:hypothetical protein